MDIQASSDFRLHSGNDRHRVIKPVVVSGQPGEVLDEVQQINKYRRHNLKFVFVVAKEKVPHSKRWTQRGDPQEDGLCPQEEGGL